jgi:hypothetical protein
LIKHIKTGQWVLIYFYEAPPKIGLVLDKDNLGDWIVAFYSDNRIMKTGTWSTRDLIPLHNCTGWDYKP